jgi:hypothetical protein
MGEMCSHFPESPCNSEDYWLERSRIWASRIVDILVQVCCVKDQRCLAHFPDSANSTNLKAGLEGTALWSVSRDKMLDPDRAVHS